MIFGAGYGLWLSNRILFGNLKNSSISFFKDLTRFEFWIFAPFVLLTFLFGIFPAVITNFLTVF
jgi:NADH-quinone oxidoreductase subunit M